MDTSIPAFKNFLAGSANTLSAAVLENKDEKSGGFEEYTIQSHRLPFLSEFTEGNYTIHVPLINHLL